MVLIFPKLSSVDVRDASRVTDHPPLGILTIAATLLEWDYNPIIMDEQVEDDFYTKLNLAISQKPICVGISSMSGSHIKSALKICEYIKSNSDIPIVLGGVHASLSPMSSINNNLVDMIVVDDGEDSFRKLVKYLDTGGNLEEIEGIAYKQDGKVNFNPPKPYDIEMIPKIPYYLVDLNKYSPGPLHFWTGRNTVLPMETSRGCPYNCSFCTESVRKKKWRALSAEKVIEDIEFYKEKYGVANFLLIDDNFFGDKKRAERIIDLMISRNLNIKWYTNVRADFLVKQGEEYLRKLEKAGCKMLTFGAESGTQRIMDMIDKNGDIADLYKIDKMIKKTKIIPHFCTIRGFPTEKKEEVKNTYLFTLKLILTNNKACCDIPHLIPTPGTKICKECLGAKAESYTLDEWEKAFEADKLPDKPEWVLDETYKFMKDNEYCNRFISAANRKELSPFSYLVFRMHLRLVIISLKLGFSKNISKIMKSYTAKLESKDVKHVDVNMQPKFQSAG